jgi:uncharacterized protein (TIGR03437 family)
MLSGLSYQFRHVHYTVGDTNGDLSRAVSISGAITFNSGGTYSITGQEMDSNSGQTTACTFSVNGTYGISASGFGFISNPLYPSDMIWGAVSSNHIFVGSTTETASNYNDLFVAAQASASTTVSTLQGSYAVAYMNFPDGDVTDLITAGFQMTTNGSGSGGTVNILAYQGNNPGVTVAEDISYTYSKANNSGTLGFPNLGPAIAGNLTLYASSDTSFIFGGNPNGYDIFLGVRTAIADGSSDTGAGNFSGVYAQAGIDETMAATTNATVTGSLQTHYGNFEAISGALLVHQRILQAAAIPPKVYSYTYVDEASVGFNSGGGYIDTTTDRQYVIGGDGLVRLGFGMTPNLGISVAIQGVQPSCPATGTTPYIFPDGVLNAASYAPYTAGVSQGELVVIFGCGFTSNSGGNTMPYSTDFNGVQVTFNDTAAAIAYVYPGQLAAIVPDISGPVQIVVNNNGTTSNTVWASMRETTPGVFTQSEDGLGDALAGFGLTPLSFLPITVTNPAMPGESVSIYTTGLGDVSAQSGPTGGILGQTFYAPSNPITVTIGGLPADVTYPALDPLGTGLYFITVTVPKGVTPGDVPLVISGPDSETAQTTIEVAAASTSTSSAAAAPTTQRHADVARMFANRASAFPSQAPKGPF